MGLNSKYTNMVPVELVNMVIDYIDYDKHYKREHKNGPFQNVIGDLIDMGYIFSTENNIRPSISSLCWGKNYVGNIYDIVDMNELYGDLDMDNLNNIADINEWDGDGYMNEDWDLDLDEETPEWA